MTARISVPTAVRSGYLGDFSRVAGSLHPLCADGPAPRLGLIGRESDILRKGLPWSIGLIIAPCILVGRQSTVLAWMLP